ncbi:hypothetical protein Pfo_016141 [Paulownia fortunei]|nr:hypothetical protein Pfo_016141 [Paulownia fortunei]
MEHNNSDTSSAENDHHQPEKPYEDSTGVGRSYECTFCKRGFTNAQALGGHMNIHRKDKAKAKAKQKNHEEPSSQNFRSNENYMNLSCFPRISSTDQQLTSCYTPLGAHANYQVYLPSSNPSFQTRNYQNNLPVWGPEHLKDHMDANLSLRIGLCPPAEHEEEGHGDRNLLENEVDLELRLGHNP